MAHEYLAVWPPHWSSALSGLGLQEPQQPPVATFRSSVDLVRVTAVVRDHKGRFVQDLTVRDFEVLDSGKSRPITEFRRDMSGVSVALLFDVSGSMEGQLAMAREAAKHVLSWLDAAATRPAVYTLRHAAGRSRRRLPSGIEGCCLKRCRG